jgi:hypothetical protein
MTDKKQTLEQVLENTRKIFENTVHNSQPDYKVILPVIRNVMPHIIAEEILGVQPMTRQPMTIGTVDHACSTWYWVKPDYDPGEIFEYTATRRRVAEIEAWIEETCGPRGSWHEPDCRWWASDRKYIFKNKEDRTMFVLRWS